MANRIPLTKELSDALSRAVESCGNVYALSQKMNVNHRSVGQWVNGEVDYLHADTLAKVLRVVRPYLNPESYAKYAAMIEDVYTIGYGSVTVKPGGEIVRNKVHGGKFHAPVDVPSSEVSAAPDGGKYPVICLAAAAGVNTLAFPLADYASENSEREQYFPNGKPGDFAIEVTGSSMLPWYPEGTVLLVRPNTRINNGDRVVAILDNGEVVFKTYAQKGDTLYLFSIDEGGKDFTFPRGQWGQIRGLYRVIASVRDEERLDESMKQRGIRHRWEEKLEEAGTETNMA